jgi:predicted phosphodiesterase
MEEAIISKERYIEEVFSHLIAAQKAQNELFDKKPVEAVKRVELPNKKSAILFLSDVHLGSIYTDYAAIRDMWQWILTTENLYVVIVGDFIDNFAAPVPKLLLAGAESQLISPEVQRQLYKTYLLALQERGKILGAVLGNHEGFAALDLWFDGQLKFPVETNRLYLWVTVGGQEYKIALVHRSRFNSIINPSHSSLRELHLNYPDADVVVTSHTHSPSVTKLLYPRDGQLLERILLKTGTLKNDPHSSQFFSPSGIGDTDGVMPCVILHPHKRRMLHADFYDAIDFVCERVG